MRRRRAACRVVELRGRAPSRYNVDATGLGPLGVTVGGVRGACVLLPFVATAVVAMTGCRRHQHETGAPPSTPRADVPLAPPLVHDGDAVFFVGNSFFGWRDRPLPQWVAEVGRALTPPTRLEVGANIVLGNTPLGELLVDAVTQEALRSRRYRVWVLAAEEFEPVDHKARFHQAVRDFDRAVRESGGRTVLFMTWDFPWRPFIAELADSYDEIAHELGIPVVPAGLVFHDAHLAPPAGRGPYWLLEDTGDPSTLLHQNELGSAANAYVTFAVLTGRDPRGARLDAVTGAVDDAALRHLSDLAFARAVERLRLPAGPDPATEAAR